MELHIDLQCIINFKDVDENRIVIEIIKHITTSLKAYLISVSNQTLVEVPFENSLYITILQTLSKYGDLIELTN